MTAMPRRRRRRPTLTRVGIVLLLGVAGASLMLQPEATQAEVPSNTANARTITAPALGDHSEHVAELIEDLGVASYPEF